VTASAPARTASRRARYAPAALRSPRSAAAAACSDQLAPCCLAAQNDLPGPGTYEQDAKLIDSKVYSKKGLGGGFASKTVRITGGT
jgi:hypothetical protein